MLPEMFRRTGSVLFISAGVPLAWSVSLNGCVPALEINPCFCPLSDISNVVGEPSWLPLLNPPPSVVVIWRFW